MADKTKQKKRNLDEVDPLTLASVLNPDLAVAVEQAQQQPQAEVRPSEYVNPVTNWINQYVREAKYDIKEGNIPKGKYVIPAIGVLSAFPYITKSAISGFAKPFIEGYKFRGLSGAIRRGIMSNARDVAAGTLADITTSPITKNLDDTIKPIANGIIFGAGINGGRNLLKSFRTRFYDNLHPVGYDIGEALKAGVRSLRDMVTNIPYDLKTPRGMYAFDYLNPTSMLAQEGKFSIPTPPPSSIILSNARQDAWALYNKLPQTYNTFHKVSGSRDYYIPDLNNSYFVNHDSNAIRKAVQKAINGEGNKDILNSSGGFTSNHKFNVLQGDINDTTKPLIGTIDYWDDWDINGFQDYRPSVWLDKHKLSFLKDLELGDITGALPFKVKTSIPIIREGNTYKLIQPSDKSLPKAAKDLIADKNKFYYSGLSHFGTKEKLGGCVSRRTLATGGSIHINPANRGKFNATKARTGKTTEELTHSKNPLTRKRAIFAQNAAKWHH